MALIEREEGNVWLQSIDLSDLFFRCAVEAKAEKFLEVRRPLVTKQLSFQFLHTKPTQFIDSFKLQELLCSFLTVSREPVSNQLTESRLGYNWKLG